MSAASRSGFSLLEVLMATSILLGSVIVLGQLAEVGRKNAAAAEDRATAQLLCSTKLQEMLAGITPMESSDEEAFEENPDWMFSSDLTETDHPGLLVLRVTVERKETDRGKPSRYTLVRWVSDPNGSGNGGVFSSDEGSFFGTASAQELGQ
jgi:type II secretion system protein I